MDTDLKASLWLHNLYVVVAATVGGDDSVLFLHVCPLPPHLPPSATHSSSLATVIPRRLQPRLCDSVKGVNCAHRLRPRTAASCLCGVTQASG